MTALPSFSPEPVSLKTTPSRSFWGRGRVPVAVWRLQSVWRLRDCLGRKQTFSQRSRCGRFESAAQTQRIRKDDRLRPLQSISAILAGLAILLTSQTVAAQDDASSGAVFALIDNNEWCPGGSVYLDLESGSFLLYPRQARATCADPDARPSVERGTVEAGDLPSLRAAYLKARRAGLEKEVCQLVVSNGGPEALVITGPAFSAKTPENDGCWSDEAIALHDELFRMFGQR